MIWSYLFLARFLYHKSRQIWQLFSSTSFLLLYKVAYTEEPTKACDEVHTDWMNAFSFVSIVFAMEIRLGWPKRVVWDPKTYLHHPGDPRVKSLKGALYIPRLSPSYFLFSPCMCVWNYLSDVRRSLYLALVFCIILETTRPFDVVVVVVFVQ